jgi:hypothetical protein
MIVNLTPHPLHIYPPDTPDRIAADSVTPLRVLPPSAQYQPARLGHQVIGAQRIDDAIPVVLVAFGPADGRVSDLPQPRPNTWYVVSLVVGIAAAHRTDLLVVHEYVRDLDGHVIGSRMLARPAAIADTAPATPMRAGTLAAAPSRPDKARPWCNYAIHRTTSPRRGAGSKRNKMIHGASKRRWLRSTDEWWQQRQVLAAAPTSRPSRP